MALVSSNLLIFAMGNRRMHQFDLAFDSVYPVNGESLDLGLIRLREINIIIISPTDGYLFEYDYDNEKVKVLTPVAEVIDSLQASVDSGELDVKSSAEDGDIISMTGNAGIDAAVAGEVVHGTDLSGLTGVRCLAIGY